MSPATSSPSSLALCFLYNTCVMIEPIHKQEGESLALIVLQPRRSRLSLKSYYDLRQQRAFRLSEFSFVCSSLDKIYLAVARSNNQVPSRSVWVGEKWRIRRGTRCCSCDMRRVWRGDHTYRSVRRAGSVALRAMFRDGGSFEA